MLQLSEEISCSEACIRIDVYGSQALEHVLQEMTFLHYRLAQVKLESEIRKADPDIVWYQNENEKSIEYENNLLTMRGEWLQGEIQKVIVAIMSQRMELKGLHCFHASAIRHRDLTIMFLSGESNHGKSMSQIEGCRRGGFVVSTETTVTDERGWAVLGSKSVFLRQRSKGTERADKLNQDQGVGKFFEKVPEFINYNEPSDVDVVIVPCIDGHFDTSVAELSQFEKEYQTFHSLSDYIGLKELLGPRVAMPILEDASLRRKRADFCHRFCERPYFLIRAKTPQILFNEVELLLQELAG